MFKKLFVLPLALLFLFVCGCAAKPKSKPILNNISFIAEIDYGDNKFVCDTAISENVLKLTVTEPDEIQDLNLTISQTEVETEFKGGSYTKSLDELASGSVAKIFHSLLNDILDNKSASYNDENCEITGKAEGFKYVFVFSPSGLPISLCVDELDLKIVFKNASII